MFIKKNKCFPLWESRVEHNLSTPSILEVAKCFAMKDQIVDILSFVDYVFSILITKLCH
jgi:hypothetical protein